jgi:hypothetical protein
MLGDFCQRARTKPDRKPGDECARLRRLPALARRLERPFGESVTVAHIGHDLPERWGFALRLSPGEHLVQEIFLPDHPAIRLPAVEHFRVPVASARLDKGRKALPGRCTPACRSPTTRFPTSPDLPYERNASEQRGCGIGLAALSRLE